MHAQGYAKSYTQAQVTSVDSKGLLLLMFEGGSKFLRLAREGLVQGDLVRFGDQLRRAQAIVSELLSTLDQQAGGQIAADLARLYDFMLFHLTEANAKKSVRHVDDVIRVFDIVADAFRQVLSRVDTDVRVATARV
jgi:flagellar secretion chaperone FliS